MITSNRDEIITREAALPPKTYAHQGSSLAYPRDPQGGGTWIATGAEMTVCLFNGAFEPHERKNSYRVSRGTVPIALSGFNSVTDFVRHFDFSGIEPFSVVVYRPGQLHEVKWDEKKPHLITHSVDEPHIWASATLYSPEVRKTRQHWFDEWLQSKPVFDREHIISFHTQEKSDKENGLLIQRDNGLRTVSVCSVEHQERQPSYMQYIDLVNQRSHGHSI